MNVQNAYLSQQDLASVYVNTPDHRREHPVIGQQITIEWCVEKNEYDENCCWELLLQLRYRSRESEKVSYPLYKRKGFVEHKTVGDDFFSKGGVQTFKVDLLCDGSLVEEWRHQTWSEVIDIERF